MILALLPACGGGGSAGGGGGSPLAPTLMSAVVSDATPQSGDRLTLNFSADITLAANAILNDQDLVFSGPGSVGSVQGAPSLIHSRALQLSLGAGVNLSPGTTKIALATTQDIVLDASGKLLRSSSQVTIQGSDGNRPSVSLLTANGVMNLLNGNGSAGGKLLLPRNGFSIDAEYSDPSSAIDSSKIYLSADRPVFVGGSQRSPGSNLATLLSGTVTATSASWSFGSMDSLPIGDTTLTLTVADSSGEVSTPQSLTVQSLDPSHQLRPFESGQIWYLDTTRDLDSYSLSGTTISIAAPATPNSIPDFLEELRILGLRSDAPASNVSGGKNSNEVVLDLLKAEMLKQLGLLYSGVNVSFTFNSPGSFPSGQVTVPYARQSWSKIAIGSNPLTKSSGSSTTPDSSPLGLAFYDANNNSQEDNSGENITGLGQTRLGIMPLVLISFAINSGPNTFTLTFNPFIKNRGTPIGEDAGDRARLQSILSNATPSDSRETQISKAIKAWARFLAVVAAHECGHSMGLVADGAQPRGLFGGMSFDSGKAGATGHIRFASGQVFPNGAQEIMEPEIDYERAQATATGFNALFASYLRERGLYNPALPSKLRPREDTPPLLSANLDQPVRYDLAWRDATQVAIARVRRVGLGHELRVERFLKGEGQRRIRLLSLDRTGAHERVFVSKEPWLVFLRQSGERAMLLQNPGVQTRIVDAQHQAVLIRSLERIAALQLSEPSQLGHETALLLQTANALPGRYAACASALLAAVLSRPEARAQVSLAEGQEMARRAGEASEAPALRRLFLSLAVEAAPSAALLALRSQLRGEDAPRYARHCAAALSCLLPGREIEFLKQQLDAASPARIQAVRSAMQELGSKDALRALEHLGSGR